MVYHNKLGTQGDRVQRVATIARSICGLLGNHELTLLADRAAALAKADLLTDMVGEFPELQGIMGRYYALHEGALPDVADAIEDHYKPRFAGDDLPRGMVGIVVALADKLETLTGMFGIGQLPTGDRDPFALRRHALGVIRMLIERDLNLPLDTLLAQASLSFAGIKDFKPAEVILADFIYDRLAGGLREQGYSAQELTRSSANDQTARRYSQATRSGTRFAALPESAALAAANKLVGNILKKVADSDPSGTTPSY